MSLHGSDTGKTKNFLGLAGDSPEEAGAPRMERQMPFPLSLTALLKRSQEQLGKKNKTKASKLEGIETFSIHRQGPTCRNSNNPREKRGKQ